MSEKLDKTIFLVEGQDVQLSGVYDRGQTDITAFTFELRVSWATGEQTYTSTIVDATAGEFLFTIPNTDTVAGLGQRAQVRVTDGASQVKLTSKFIFNVESSLWPI